MIIVTTNKQTRKVEKQRKKKKQLLSINNLTVPKLWITNQKPCLLSWFSTITSHQPDIIRCHGQFLKLALFLQTLEMKITTELQRKVKLLHLLNEKVICLMLSEKTNASSRQNVTRLHCQALSCTFTDNAETFLFQNEARFSKFLS